MKSRLITLVGLLCIIVLAVSCGPTSPSGKHHEARESFHINNSIQTGSEATVVTTYIYDSQSESVIYRWYDTIQPENISATKQQLEKRVQQADSLVDILARIRAR